MRLINIVILLFLLAALTIGSSISQYGAISIMDSAINNASLIIQNITFEDIDLSESQNIPNVEGLFLILEKYIHFIGTFAMEILRAGVHFGYENPDYFNPDFITKLIMWIVVLLIISLLIKPVGYLIIFIVMLGIYIKDKFKKKKK